jgi:hypothetical protein
MYAGYGQLTAQGKDAYVHDVDELADSDGPDDAVFEGLPPHTANVYGPIAQKVFGISASVAGPSLRNTVWLFQIIALCAFLALALLLDFAAGFRKPSESADARARVALLWICNPILLFELVNGAHIDAIAVALGLIALLLVARSAIGSGILVGMSIAVKVSYGIYAVAIAWALIRSGRKLVGYSIAASLTTLLLYLHARTELTTLQLASKWVSSPSPWGPIDGVLSHASTAIARLVVSTGTIVLLVIVARRLDSGLPRGDDDARGRAIRTAVLLGSAWLLTSPYAFPWYDALVWAPLVLLPASGVDLVMLARITIVGVAYLPGGTALQGFTATARSWVNGGLAPILSIALVALVIVAGPRLALRSSGKDREPTAPPDGHQPIAASPSG